MFSELGFQFIASIFLVKMEIVLEQYVIISECQCREYQQEQGVYVDERRLEHVVCVDQDEGDDQAYYKLALLVFGLVVWWS